VLTVLIATAFQVFEVNDDAVEMGERSHRTVEVALTGVGDRHVGLMIAEPGRAPVPGRSAAPAQRVEGETLGDQVRGRRPALRPAGRTGQLLQPGQKSPRAGAPDTDLQSPVQGCDRAVAIVATHVEHGEQRGMRRPQLGHGRGRLQDHRQAADRVGDRSAPVREVVGQPLAHRGQLLVTLVQGQCLSQHGTV
jgi:hypothetical protein